MQELTKKFGNVLAVSSVDLEVKDKEFLVLVGPSGCGKTTALRCVAGLEEITSGKILIGDRVVNDVMPKDRDIAMVFQNYALYPHMNVYDNMAFGLRLRMLPPWYKGIFNMAEVRQTKGQIDKRVHDTAELLGLGHLLKRRPKELSGGQRQRVALGRAIVREPAVFLMDEPLSNLDAKLRVQTRAELIKLHVRLGITTIYVTHDQIEAMTMGDRIAVMKDGLVQQCDRPLEIYNHPANLFVAGFIGSPEMNTVEATIKSSNGDLLVDVDSFRVKLPEHRKEAMKPYVDKKVMFGIRPEDIYDKAISLVPSEPGNTVGVTVEITEPMGSSVLLELDTGKGKILTANAGADTKARIGEPLEVVLDMSKSHVFDLDNEKAVF